MNAPFLHSPDFPPDMAGQVRVDAFRFAQWVVSIPLGKRGQAARVARYLAIRANRNHTMENQNEIRL
jgi:hypothetical protein